MKKYDSYCWKFIKYSTTIIISLCREKKGNAQEFITNLFLQNT